MIWSIPQADLDRLAGRDVVVSVSGGKDSTAVALLLQRAGIRFRAIMMDTGWEHPATPAYVREVVAPLIGGVEILESVGMPELVRSKGIFPSRTLRFCTEELKIRPFLGWLEREYPDRAARPARVVSVVGIRRAESAARSTAERWWRDPGLDVDVWRPLVEHSYDDVIAMHHEAGLRPNPLYLRGAQRVGCFPCIYARKAEIAAVAEMLPERIDEIAALEGELTGRIVASLSDPDNARSQRERAVLRVAFLVAREAHGGLRWLDWKRHLARGDVLTAPQAALQARLVAEVDAGAYAHLLEEAMRQASLRTFFQGRAGREARPIAEVVEWASGYGQLDLLDAEVDSPGCWRWGFCEPPTTGDAA